MVKAIYTTFDGKKFDDIEKAKSHEQYETEKSPVRVLGEILNQLAKGKTLSTKETDYISFRPKYGSVFVTKSINGFGLIHTISVYTAGIFLEDQRDESLVVRISWHEGGQYSVSCELEDEGLQFVQSIKSKEDTNTIAKQLEKYFPDEIYEVLKKTYKGEL